MEKIYSKQSLWSKIVYKIIRIINQKEHSKTVSAAKKYLLKISKFEKYYDLPLKYGFEKGDYNEMPVFTYNGNINDTNKKILIYIHGGSYAEQAISFQIKFAKKVAKKTNSLLVMPIYPLIPEGNCLIAQSLILNLYKYLKKHDNEINLLGDSAGGGFILSFGMLLKDMKISKPKNIIAMSPWLDVSMNNENLYQDEKFDFMCGVDGTRYFGELWADGLPLNDYRVSPIYGDFKNIGKITLIYGGKEIFTSECKKMVGILKSQNVKFNNVFFENEGHDFGTLPTKEGNMIIDIISNIINQL